MAIRTISTEIFAGFSGRKPWAAIIVAILLSPVGGMLYLGRWRRAVIYAVGFLAILPVWLLAAHISGHSLALTQAPQLAGLFIWIIGAIDTGRVAARRQENAAVPWFAKWHVILAICYILPSLYFGLGWQHFTVGSDSMRPTLARGDGLLTWVAAYGISFEGFLPLLSYRLPTTKPVRGDVAAFKAPKDPGVVFIKRIVGMPGDRIRLHNGILQINGIPVRREKLGGFEYSSAPDGPPAQFTEYRETLPNGRNYAILEVSDTEPSDDTPEIVVPEGHFYVLGDNRDRSWDSRFADKFGTVPAENLIGRVTQRDWDAERRKIPFLSPRAVQH